MAKQFAENESGIHFAYKNFDNGPPETLPTDFKNIIKFDAKDGSTENLNFISRYISENAIQLVFGFDFPVALPTYSAMRKAGAKKIVSYYGASMSGINSGIKLLLKRLEVFLKPHKPDLFIFESKAMRNTAVDGRGINKKNTAIIRLGVDTNRFKPNPESLYAYETFNIPHNRKIVFYSGHMQTRKWVYVIVKAAAELINQRNRKDIHFLLVGNKIGEEKQFDEYYTNTPAEDYITFGGYRNDIPDILPSCYVGTIASTGWDSFTMSSIEMASTGLPLIVSRLQGLVETIEEGKTGFLFDPGDHNALADKIEYFIDNPSIRNEFSSQARKRTEMEFSKETQLQNLVSALNGLE
ncbi:MAG TPA: glycosyltransferase family 4 protein [Gammaproteobacteria bacterium]